MESLLIQSQGVIGERSASERALPAKPEEDWTKISDLAERRRIQNRIAQRNYRKKIKERMADLNRRAGRDAKSTSRARDSSSEGNKLEIREDKSDKENHPLIIGSARRPMAPNSTDKKYVCGDDVDNGFHWGCGRRFSRAGGLRRHFRSETGKVCVKGLLDQASVQEDGDSSVAGLPTALVRRYPFLAATKSTKLNEEDHANDDRSRFDSSDYESDDAGYISGTETGSIMKAAPTHSSSTRGNVKTANRFQPLVDSAHDPWYVGQRPSSEEFSQPPYDRSSGVATPRIKPGLPSSFRQISDVEKELPFSNLGQQDDLQLNHEYFPKTAVPNEEFSDTCDDNMSLRSFTESVFDVGSVISSASSSHSNSHTMVGSFVEILLLDPNMDRLLALATSEFGVSSGRFTRNFSRILKSYSRHLRQAIKELWLPKHVQDGLLVASKAVYNCRHQISSLVAARYNERAPSAETFQHRQVHIITRHLDQVRVGRGGIDELSSNEESGGEEADFTTADVKEFLVSGEPFWLLKRNLRSLVIPDRFLECIYESTSAFLDLLLADRRIRFTVHGLRHALLLGREIQSGLNTQFRLMAARLRTEYTSTAQLDASIFLETYAEYISITAIDHINITYTSLGRSVLGSAQMPDKAPHKKLGNRHFVDPQAGNNGSSLPHEHVLEHILAETLPSVLYVDLMPHWKFLASSEAFSSLADALRDLAYPTFFSEAKKFILEEGIEPPHSSEDRIPELEGQRLLAIIAEMEFCLLSDDSQIHFSVNPSASQVGAMDRMKLWIEASTASEWDWWPLQPPNRPRNQDKAGLSWLCSCGTIRREVTLKSYASELRRIFKKFPLSRPDSSRPPDRPPSSHSNSSSQNPNSTQSISSSSTNHSGKQSFSGFSSSANSAITPPGDDDDSVVDFSNGPRRYIYVFFLVKTSEYILDTIDVSLMTTRDFFQALRAAYWKHTSLWRRVFSVFVYNHCDFIKIIKPEPETFIPGDLAFELPPDQDDEYHYRPRPTFSAPVSRHMFKHYFYGCYENDAFLHRLHTCIPLVPRCRIRNPAGDILDLFPKRDRPMATASQSEKVEVCYGIAAREFRSFFRVLVYLCLIMAPAFWFVFAWLFMWGDRGDLQDATIPMTLMLGMLSILWAVVHSGSDVRKAYGDA